MARFIIILLVGLFFEAVGVTLLSKGLKSIGGLEKISLDALAAFVPKAVTHPTFLLGVLFETVFFCILIYLLAQKDVSLVWPLTALGFDITALSAKVYLGEQISAMRWTGVILIVAGAMLVSYSEALKSGKPTDESSHSPVSTSE
jgi:uncharacterized membrane protein